MQSHQNHGVRPNTGYSWHSKAAADQTNANLRRTRPAAHQVCQIWSSWRPRRQMWPPIIALCRARVPPREPPAELGADQCRRGTGLRVGLAHARPRAAKGAIEREHPNMCNSGVGSQRKASWSLTKSWASLQSFQDWAKNMDQQSTAGK